MQKLTLKPLKCWYLRRQKKATILIALSVLTYILISLAAPRIMLEETKNEKFLFCFILTASKYIDSRAVTIEQTWAKDCDKHFFISTIVDNLTNGTMDSSEIMESYEKVPILQPRHFKNDSYTRLTKKVYMTIRDVHKRYGDYEWYLKADDDTFVFVDNLKKFLKTKNSADPLTYGYNFRTIVAGGYHSGGAGYVIPNKVFNKLGDKLNDNLTNCMTEGAEDVNVARCLRQMNVSVGQSLDHLGRERFHLFDVDRHLNGPNPDWLYKYAMNNISVGAECCSDETVTFHYMNSAKIQKLYDLWTKYKTEQPSKRNFTRMLYDHL